MLMLLSLVLLIFSIADTVARFNGPALLTPTCSDGHDWYDLVDTEGNDQGLICGLCKKTPTMISEEHVPNDASQ